MVTIVDITMSQKRISARISTNQQWVTWAINCYRQSWISSSVWRRQGLVCNTMGLNTNCWSWPTFYPCWSAGHLGDGSSDLLMLRLPTGGSVMPHVAPWYWVRRLIGTASQSPTLPVETIKRGAQTILATTSNMIDKFEKQDLNWNACVIEICSRCLHKVVL